MKKTTIACIMMMAATLLGGCAKKSALDKSGAALSPAPSAGETAAGTEAGALNQQDVADSSVPGGESREIAGLTTIYFDFDSYVLSDASRRTLRQNFEWLKNRPEAKATIEGHADERGSDEYNLALGEKRAVMAMEYLLGLGLPAERMNTISYGEEKPAVEGNDEGSWSKNRRVEFR